MSGKGGLSFGHPMDKIGKLPVKFLSFSTSKQDEGENIIYEKWELLNLEEIMMVNIIETLNIHPQLVSFDGSTNKAKDIGAINCCMCINKSRILFGLISSITSIQTPTFSFRSKNNM